jgi:2-(1,2-epoxy-1,2-dihydrophenyl)acetyl-CoA isomerase
MTYTAMRLEREDGLVRLTFCQPARGNPIDGAFCAEFCDVANELSSDTSVRAILIGAEGRNFSFGGDIAMFLENLDTLPLQIRKWTADLHVGIARMQRLDAPIVAAVHGVCAGGMAGMIAGADIVVAEPSTRFVAAYAGIGYCCDAGSSIMLSRRMGLSRARKYLLLNETLDAPTALAAGLCDEVADAAALTARAEQIARQLAAGPTAAYGEIRRLLVSAACEPMDVQLEREAQGLARIAGTADAREGLAAFGEKRKAQFVGR